jgi:hypothetical protein
VETKFEKTAYPLVRVLVSFLLIAGLIVPSRMTTRRQKDTDGRSAFTSCNFFRFDRQFLDMHAILEIFDGKCSAANDIEN